MTKPGRPLTALLLAALLAFVAVGCGVDSSDGASSDDTPAAESTTTADDSSDETTTTVDEGDEGDETTTTDPDSSDSTIPSIPTIPEGMEDQFREQLEIGFKSAGLSDDEASCLADAYVDEFGSDASQATDFQAMLDLFTGCGIDPTALGGG